MTGSAGERIYDRSPRAVQSLVLSAYGLRTLARTQGFKRVVRSMAPTETWPPEVQRQYVMDSVRAILDHAVHYVPRYRGYRWLSAELQDSSTNALELLREFPRVTRAEVMADHAAFQSQAFKKRDLVVTRTSGTTGTPMETLVERSALRVSDALWWRRALWAGYERGDWTARLVGDHVIGLDERHPAKPYHISSVDRRIYLSTFHLSRQTAGAMKSVLEERQPAFLQGYPSALSTLSALAGPCESEWHPKAVLYSSEPLYEHQRAEIKHFVHAPLRGLYGCAERIVSAAECSSGTLHLSLLDGYVEGQFDGEGHTAPAVVTGLINRAMPLIRFELGDTLEFRDGVACQCGRTLPALGPVVTKVEDSVVTGSGRVISPSILTWAFKDLSGVRKSQIVQRRDLSVCVRVVAEESAKSLIRRDLERRIAAMLFDEVPVSVEFVDTLEVAASGKSRFVVREPDAAARLGERGRSR
jgi:phenylacetate-CoA ligase